MNVECLECGQPYDDDGQQTCLCHPSSYATYSGTQTKSDSVIEAVANIAIGAGVALLAQLVWFPIIGKDFSLMENLATTGFFTVVSFVRSYSIRRIFNGRSVYQTIKGMISK